MNHLIPVLALTAAAMSACSSQQLYAGGQSWQRQECQKLIDADQRNRCLNSTAGSYEDYQRESQAARQRR